MQRRNDSQSGNQSRPHYVLWLIGCAAFSALMYAFLLQLSWKFSGKVEAMDRPTLTMLGLFGAAFTSYFLALWLVQRLEPTRRLIVGIFAAACLFRLILLPSLPMHEIDIYRYIWDGAVLADGVSPYQYAPQQIVQAIDDPKPIDDPILQQLIDLQATSRSLSESLVSIHYGQYPSPYPIVSQAVFATAAKLTPDDASITTRLTVMKTLLVLFDLATLAVVICLLRDVGLHPGLSLAYGWCPLLMKEVANAGHLDSIAIFFTTLAVWLLVRATRATTRAHLRIAAAGLALALGIGAKLYPVVLLPLFAAVWLRRQGWWEALIGTCTTALVSSVLLYPLFGGTQPDSVSKPITHVAVEPDIPGQLNAPATTVEPIVVESDDGIQAFLKQWEMNDLVFMFVLENLRQQAEVEPHQRPWFVVTSDDWSRRVVTGWIQLKKSLPGAEALTDLRQPPKTAQLRTAAFSLARLLTGGAFALAACLLAWLAAGRDDPKVWCRAALLTLAWFWLTCPTQNPWYWCWALPLLPFARYRTWYAVAAVTMLYYLRFWLNAHFADELVLGTPYYGAYFFFFVIAWIEFVPVFVTLAVEWLMTRRRRSD